MDSTAVGQPIVGTLSYNGHQQLKAIDRGGSAPTTTFSYYDKNSTTDSLTYTQAKPMDRWLHQIEHGGVNQLPNFTYVDYDLVGNIEELETLHQSWTETQDFTYDSLYRLDTGTATNGIANYNFNYNYDFGGNIMSRNGSGGNRTYSYNPARPHAVTAVDQSGTADDLAFTYDHNGNMYERYRAGVKTHHQGFDIQNRLQYVTANNQRTDFYYDASGQRVLTIQPGGAEIYTPFPELEQEIRPTAFHVDIQRYQTNDARLTWQHDSQFSSYTVWHSTKPYFTPGDPSSTALGTVNAPNSAYVHTNALADNVNGYYIVVGHGATDVLSNRVGEFNFDLIVETSRVSQVGKPASLPKVNITAKELQETTTTITRVTYQIDGQMIGVRVSGHPNPANNGLFYTYNDHLGSVAALSNANGSYVSGSLGLHRPFGSYRVEPTTNPDITDRGYTGHRENLDIQLTYMNARYHLSEIGRFASPDSIVPDPLNPQSLNRYTYGLNNPINFTDPTGHIACASTEMCSAGTPGAHYQQSISSQSTMYGVVFTADTGKSWTKTQQQVALMGVRDVDTSLRGLPEFNGYSQGQAFKAVFGSVTFHRSARTQWFDADGNAHDIDYGAQAFGRRIEFYDDAAGVDPLNPKFRYNVVHELGHVFNYMINENSDANPYAALGGALGGALPSRNTVRKGMEPYPLQQNTRSTKNENYELFADGFLNWTYGSFRGNTEGNQTSNWFNTQMPLWVSATGS